MPGFIKAVIARGQDRHDDGLGRRGRQDLCARHEGRGRAQGHLGQGAERQLSERVVAGRGQAAAGARRTPANSSSRTATPTAALGKAAKVIEAEYTTNINIHAPMEPMNATAEIKDGILHLYTGNQFMTRSTAIAAGAAGIDPKNVVIHQAWLGGGFGRRLDSDMMVPAALAAKAVGKPVKVIYSPRKRHDDGFLAAADLPEDRAGVDDNGKLIAIDHDLVSAWPTKRWGIPGFLTPVGRQEGRARRLRRARRGLLSTPCPTTRSARSSTNWRRAPRRRANCARWRRVGRSGRSRA